MLVALGYAKRGWAVLPVHWPLGNRCSCARESCQSVAKHPLTPHGVHDATTGPEVIQSWWERWPLANLGVATGKYSNLVVLDVDSRHAGIASLDELEKRHGRLPHTLKTATGGGGYHFFFSTPGHRVGNKLQLGGWPGIDLKADAGYVVVPPSIHVSAKSYTWIEGHGPNDVKPVALPRWLLKLATEHLQNSNSPRAQQWRTLVVSGAKEGLRNITLTKLIGHLLARGIDPLVVIELVIPWNGAKNQPPLPEGEVLRTVDSIARLELQRRLGRKGKVNGR